MTVIEEKDQSSQSKTTEDLEAELEQVSKELRAQSGNKGLTQLAAVFGVLIALAAMLAVTFKLQDNNDAAQAMHNRMNGAAPAAPANMPGISGDEMSAGGGSAQADSVDAARQVNSTLGEFWVRPDKTSVPAGKIEFTVRNTGQVEHELMVERMPMKMDAPGQPNEDASQGMIEDMAPGESGKMTVNLKPGMYVLFCNVAGHYAAGQHTMLRVTGRS